MQNQNLNQQIYPSMFKDKDDIVDVYSDNLDEDYIDAEVLTENKNKSVSNSSSDLQNQLKNRSDIHFNNAYGSSVTDRNIMEQAHADGRRLQYMNQTSAHVRPIDPVYNSLQQNLVTPSNVGPQYNQGTKLCHHAEDILGDKDKIGKQDLLSLKGNEGKSYLTTNSDNYTPQDCTTHPVVPQ